MRKFAEVQTELKSKHDAVGKLYDEIGEGEPSQTQVDSVIQLNKDIEELEKEAADAKAWEDQRAKHGDRDKEFKTAAPIVLPNATSDNEEANRKARKQAIKALSDYFFDNAEIKAYLDNIAPLTGEKGMRRPVSNDMHIQSPRAAIPVTIQELKALVTGLSDTSGGALIGTDYQQPPLVFLGMRPLTIRDLITIGQTNSDLVEYPQAGALTNNAAPVAEATDTSTGTKPESGLALTKVTTAVKTIAHWIPATKRAIADAGQIRTLIDNFLRYGLAEELEDQVISGDGTGENLTGILNTAGITAQAYDTSILTTARKARTKAYTVGRARPTAYALHPLDWEAFDLTQDNEARYYFGGPSVIGNPRLWGLPVVETEALPQGTGLTGDFKQAVLWDREQASVSMSDSHANFFVQNLVAILAELRAAFGVFRPAALVSIDLTP